MHSFFFIKSGVLAFVMPHLDNAVYKWIQKGKIVGFEDYPYYLLSNGSSYDNLETIELHPSKIKRRFTVIAKTKVEALELPISEVIKMQHEFPHVMEMIYNSCENRVRKLLQERLAIQNQV